MLGLKTQPSITSLSITAIKQGNLATAGITIEISALLMFICHLLILLNLNVSLWAHLLVHNNKQTHLQLPAHTNLSELKLGHWI